MEGDSEDASWSGSEYSMDGGSEYSKDGGSDFTRAVNTRGAWGSAEARESWRTSRPWSTWRSRSSWSAIATRLSRDAIATRNPCGTRVAGRSSLSQRSLLAADNEWATQHPSHLHNYLFRWGFMLFHAVFFWLGFTLFFLWWGFTLFHCCIPVQRSQDMRVSQGI
jgi:hypothetical protein